MSTLEAIHRRALHLLLVAAVALAACKKSEKPKSSKHQRQDALAHANDEQLALNKFTAAVREILVWHQSQPVGASPTERQKIVSELAQKMENVPVAGLAEGLAKAWTPMLKAWQDLAKTESADAKLREAGAKAAAELNRQLAARGVMDLKF